MAAVSSSLIPLWSKLFTMYQSSALTCAEVSLESSHDQTYGWLQFHLMLHNLKSYPSNGGHRLASHADIPLTVIDAKWCQHCHELAKHAIYIHSFTVHPTMSTLWLPPPPPTDTQYMQQKIAKIWLRFIMGTTPTNHNKEMMYHIKGNPRQPENTPTA